MSQQDRFASGHDPARERFEVIHLVGEKRQRFGVLETVAGRHQLAALNVVLNGCDHAVGVLALTRLEGIEHRSPIHERWPASLPAKRAPLCDEQGQRW